MGHNVKKQRLQKANEAELYDENGNLVARGNIHMNFSSRKQPNKFFGKGKFFTMSRLFASMMKTKKEYNNLTFRLLFELLERIEFDNRIRIFRQSELAEILDSQQSHVSVSLRLLIADNIIEKRGYEYYFTEEFVQYAKGI